MRFANDCKEEKCKEGCQPIGKKIAGLEYPLSKIFSSYFEYHASQYQ